MCTMNMTGMLETSSLNPAVNSFNGHHSVADNRTSFDEQRFNNAYVSKQVYK